MIVKEFQDYYTDEVIRLFVEEYKVDFKSYKDNFIQFFEHSFQKNCCIRIIAIDDRGNILGFQSFFYWPYARNGKTYTVYQSGSSIVSKRARGQGVFQKMLSHSDEVKGKYGIDFMIGFPVEASYKSFISNGWNNPFDLHWYMKVKNPLGFLFSWLYKNNKHLPHPGPFISDNFKLENTRQFLDWREGFQKDKYRVFYFKDDLSIFQVNHKVNKRKRIFNELIIGEILCNETEGPFLLKAFHKYKTWLLFQVDIAILSFCTSNEQDVLSQQLIQYVRLKRIDKKIYFITKYAEKMNKEDWSLYRSDIDTW